MILSMLSCLSLKYKMDFSASSEAEGSVSTMAFACTMGSVKKMVTPLLGRL